MGDSSWDEAAAVSAGCDFVGVTNGAPSVFSAGATVVRDLGEVLAHL